MEWLNSFSSVCSKEKLVLGSLTLAWRTGWRWKKLPNCLFDMFRALSQLAIDW